MLDINSNQNYTGPTTTANSVVDGRMKVDVGQYKSKKAIIKGKIKKIKEHEKRR